MGESSLSRERGGMMTFLISCVVSYILNPLSQGVCAEMHAVRCCLEFKAFSSIQYFVLGDCAAGKYKP